MTSKSNTAPKIEHQKISAWLCESVSSHGIYKHKPLAEDFKKCTGEEACWPTHSAEETIADVRGAKAGGSLTMEDAEFPSAYGYEIASALARKYANFRSTKMGRGFLFDDCVGALMRAGK